MNLFKLSLRQPTLAIALTVLSNFTYADGPADNQAQFVRHIPPPGIAIESSERESLQSKLAELSSKLDALRKNNDKKIQQYLPDVEIFHKAIHIALNEDGFFEKRDVANAERVINIGLIRADQLAEGSTPWTDLTCNTTTVRGFRSKLDGSIQPYGVVWNGNKKTAEKCPPIAGELYRADIWCRGRAEKGLEMQFLATRMSNNDPAPEPGVLMIHPFGRYCNANKLAGEVDTLEAIEHAMQEYPIDPQRIAIRGFSMGGAAAWHLAVHYPDRWFAANPGAGFSETPDFLKVFQSEDLKPAWYEQRLWLMYDCPYWVRNLRMLPTVAYSGEIDKQKQAADLMAAASWNLPESERFELTHVIAPNTAHKVDPIARQEIEQRLTAAENAIPKGLRRSLSFTTTTLKYNSMHWLTVEGLQEHWTPAHVRASFSEHDVLKIAMENITELSIDIPADQVPSHAGSIFILNGDSIESFHRWFPGSPEDATASRFEIAHRSDGSWGATFRRDGEHWIQVSPIEPVSQDLRKRHNLQGPIDDAFMGPFIFVKPTTSDDRPEVQKWVDAEFNRAIREWHRQMRGDVRVKTVDELKPDDIVNHNLILWGTPQSNSLIAKYAQQLPLQWSNDQIMVGDAKFNATNHVPVMIYPNPENRHRYIVINSGITYREYDYLNNARQVPKLPDWAIVDLSVAPDARWPGKIADAGFFDEKWELKPRVNQ